MRTYTLTLAGREYTAQPLMFADLRRFTLDGTLEALGGMDSGDLPVVVRAFDAIVRVISAALMSAVARGADGSVVALYPECTEEWVARHLPAGPKGAELLAAVLRESGLIPEGPTDPKAQTSP